MRLLFLLMFITFTASCNTSDPSSLSENAPQTSESATAAELTIKSSEQQACINNKGRWQQVCMLGYDFCLTAYTDAGESCSNSSQCLGSCLRDPTVSDKVVGICQANNNPCGCFEYIEADAESVALCID